MIIVVAIIFVIANEIPLRYAYHSFSQYLSATGDIAYYFMTIVFANAIICMVNQNSTLGQLVSNDFFQ